MERYEHMNQVLKDINKLFIPPVTRKITLPEGANPLNWHRERAKESGEDCWTGD